MAREEVCTFIRVHLSRQVRKTGKICMLAATTIIAVLIFSALLSLFRWHRIVWIYGVLIAFLSILMMWIKFPQFLYLSRDGGYNKYLSEMYATWADPLDITAINPLSGMVSMLVAHNPYFLPGEIYNILQIEKEYQNLLSYLINSIEIFISTYFLTRVLKLSTLTSTLSAFAALLFLVPPFNFMFGFAGWLSAAPMYGHALALSNISAIIMLKIGNLEEYNSNTSAYYFKQSVLTVAFVVTLGLFFLASPFYFAGMFVGTSLLMGCIIVSSSTWRQFFQRMLAIVAALVAMLILQFPQFYSATKSYSARFASSKPFLQIDWLGALKWPDSASWEGAASSLCAYGVWCPPYPGWPVSISPHWVYGSAVIGGLVFSVWGARHVARFGFMFAALWSALLAFWVLQSLSVIDFTLSPSFLFLMLFSVIAIFGVYAYLVPVEFIAKRLKSDILFDKISSVIVFGLSSWLLMYLVVFFNMSPVDAFYQSAEPPRQRNTPITDILASEIGLRPGELYRGSVATVLGLPNGTLRAALGADAGAPMAPGQFESFLAAAAKSGSTHDLLDLWAFNIPTLSEYGQGISPPLAFYASEFLKHEADASEGHFVFPKRLNRDVLRAMGVRFAIVDAEQQDPDLLEREQLAAGERGRLFLYELRNPNLGTYSPTTLAPIESADVFARRVQAEPNILQSVAFLRDPPQEELQPAGRSELIFEKRGIRIRASSPGRSALLLPIQFSNCYAVKPLVGSATIHRANFLHTLLIFEGDVDVRLRWRFSFWRGSACRAQDVRDFVGYPLK